MSLTKLSLAGKNITIPGQREFGQYIPPGDRKSITFFYSVLCLGECRHQDNNRYGLVIFSLIGGVGSVSIEWFIEGQAFLRSYALAPRTFPFPLFVSKLERRHIGRLRKRDNLLMAEGGREWARSRIIRLQENLVLYKYFNTLWVGFSLSGYYLSPSLQVSLSKYISLYVIKTLIPPNEI